MPTDKDQGFWRKIWKEAEPIIAHAVIIVVLEISLLLIGLGTLALEHLFPKQESYFSTLEKVDIWMTGVALHVWIVHRSASKHQAYRGSAGRSANEVIGQ